MAIERIKITTRTDWLALRMKDVTASDVACLFGEHPYKTHLQLFLEKTGGEIEDKDNPAMRRGRILEPGIAIAVSEEHPDWQLIKSDEYIRDSDLRLGATPDYEIHGDQRGVGVLECKSVASEVFDKLWCNGVPVGPTVQCLTQMILRKTDFGRVACLIDNRDKDLYEFEVPRHPAAEKLIRERTEQFWEAVAKKQMPKPDFARDAAAILAMFPSDKAPPINLTNDNRIQALLSERETLSLSKKDVESQLEAVNAEIKFKLGDSAEAIIPGWKVTHKLQERKAYEVKATSFRVLRVTNLNGKAA